MSIDKLPATRQGRMERNGTELFRRQGPCDARNRVFLLQGSPLDGQYRPTQGKPFRSKERTSVVVWFDAAGLHRNRKIASHGSPKAQCDVLFVRQIFQTHGQSCLLTSHGPVGYGLVDTLSPQGTNGFGSDKVAILRP